MADYQLEPVHRSSRRGRRADSEASKRARFSGDASTLSKPTISSPAKAEVIRAQRPLPSDDVLNALFERMVERMNLTPEKVAELNMRSPEQKWSLILAQHELQAGIASVFYIEQLVRHAQPELKERRPKRRLLESLRPLARVLSDLEVDLRTNPNDSWVQEYVSTPNHGHVALIDLIKDLADNPFSVPRKHPRKYAVLDREPGYLYTSLLCLKSLMSHRHGFTAVISYDPSLCVLAYCLSSHSYRTKVLILKLMVSVLLAPGGHSKVMQAFDYFRAIMKERMRFQLLVSSLAEEPVDPAYQAAALCFINTVVQTAQGPNARVFHQQEFVDAGFSSEDIEKSLHGRQDERVLHELKEWQNNFIDVQTYVDNLAVSKGRVRDLTEKFEQTQRYLHEANLDREELYGRAIKLMEKYEKQRQRMSRMSENINELLGVKIERDSLQEENQQLLEANKRYHMHTDELKEKIESLLSQNEFLQTREEHITDLHSRIETLQKFQSMVEGATQTSDSLIQLPTGSMLSLTAQDAGDSTVPDIPDAPIPPPIVDGSYAPPPPPIPFGMAIPPPPLIGGGFPGVPAKKAVIPNVPLPMLNWIPIKNPDHTVFKDMNDETVIETVDFSDFETLFQVKKMKKNDRTARREENLKKLAEQLCLVENRRARNLVIAKRRVGHSAVQIRDFILETDLDGLLSEHCELLQKFIPTEEELSDLAKHAHRFEEFGEAEQFMFQLAKIDRYEIRLNAMSYMGNFDELYNTARPQIDAVLSASLSVFRSSRLRKVFEIILAFGNYMNSSRRGAVYGFKLESLTKLLDTKSLDRKQTVLHYISHVVEMVYPNVLSFYEDLDIEIACQVSLQILSEDVTTLSKGLEDLEEEENREPDNFIIFSFHKQAKKKVKHLADTYAKMDDAYREVCLMFSESPKTMDPSDFFGMFAKFIADWKRVIEENHKKAKRRRMATAEKLIKKNTEEAQDTMAELAAEAAATAAARSEKIREETKKLLENRATERALLERVDVVRGEVIGNQAEDIHDITQRDVKKIDFKDRLPWLNKQAKVSTVAADEVDATTGDHEETERVTSPDSRVMDQLSEGHDTDTPSPVASPTYTVSTGTDPMPTSLHNGDVMDSEQLDQLLELPPRDYPVQLPPKDYPKMSPAIEKRTPKMKQKAPNNLLGDDNDYYALMTNGFAN